MAMTAIGAALTEVQRRLGRIALAPIVVSVLCTVSPVMAEALSTRDVLDLGKYGKNIAGISWCSDETLTFVNTQSPPTTAQDAARQPDRTVTMLSLTSGSASPLLVYPVASIHAHCVRGGDYLYVSGVADLAYQTNTGSAAQTVLRRPLNHLVEIPRGDNATKRRTTIDVLWDAEALEGPVSTDAEGNVFGRRGSTYSAIELELKDFSLKEMRSRQREKLSYTVKKHDLSFIVFSSTQHGRLYRGPKIGIYGVSTSRIGSQTLASYQCPAPFPRPGCSSTGAEKKAVYYTLSAVATSQEPDPDGLLKGYQALYTVVPGHRPLIQHWRIVSASASKLPYELVVVDVALDAERCFVLLEPSRGRRSSRVEGRLRQDILIADCQMKDGQLAYDQPRLIGSRQGSFIFQRLSLRGETVVLTDFFDQSSEEEDQIAFERDEKEKARICAQLFSGASAASLQRTNVLCAPVSRLGGGWWRNEKLVVSPNARFVAFSGPDDAMIVGRDYRSDGRGPVWLTHGE